MEHAGKEKGLKSKRREKALSDSDVRAKESDDILEAIPEFERDDFYGPESRPMDFGQLTALLNE